MLRPYALAGIFLLMVTALAVAIAILGHLLGPRRRGLRKGETYECGVLLFGDARSRFSVHFYLVAVLFILFDIETMFLIPWAVVREGVSSIGAVRWLAESGIFFGIVGLGLVYVWRQGILDEV